jgi:hypothetical protein
MRLSIILASTSAILLARTRNSRTFRSNHFGLHGNQLSRILSDIDTNLYRNWPTQGFSHEPHKFVEINRNLSIVHFETRKHAYDFALESMCIIVNQLIVIARVVIALITITLNINRIPIIIIALISICTLISIAPWERAQWESTVRE